MKLKFYFQIYKKVIIKLKKSEKNSFFLIIIIKSVCYWLENSNFSTGDGIHGFTLDSQLGEFVLTHPNVRIPKLGNIYSCNEANRYKSVHLFVNRGSFSCFPSFFFDESVLASQ